ncbi:MAG: MlaA family lipoprotein, partial [Rhodospirillales bacterium]|nr:MlaA family lipoprotein [Rhodospirillales bacterium]
MVFSVLVLVNCASAPKGDPEALAEFQKLNDPIEPTNRAIFSFNQGLDKVVIKPVTGFYRTVTPAPARDEVHSFLENLRT